MYNKLEILLLFINFQEIKTIDKRKAVFYFMQKKILVVEDELSIQAVLKAVLIQAGYSVKTASDGIEGLNLFNSESFNLVLLDIMMPRMNGYEVCKEIRLKNSTPIIILTALDKEEAQIKAFELHADDYILKPFSIKLILLRIDAVLRRTSNEESSSTDLCYGKIKIETDSMSVTVNNKAVDLTNIEYNLLLLFIKNPNRVFTRYNLLVSVWGYDFIGDDKTVNIHIMNLRHKLGIDCIETIRGVGYRLAKNKEQP